MESKRIKVIPKNPNPLFKKWLKEWIDEAEKKKKRISQVYQKSLDSLNKYPLTLNSGYDCAILENFGPKICHLLDEKLEKHLNERLDLHQQQSYEDKISEVQRRETLKVSDLIRSVEAACLTDNSFAQESSNRIDEDVEMHDGTLQHDLSNEIDVVDEQTNNSLDIEIPVELLSSSAESGDDSLDRLIRKYDPEAAKKLKKKKPTATQKVAVEHQNDNVIDISQSPPLHLMLSSPISTFPRNGTRFKKFKTFDGGKNHLAGPSYASSPISKFLDVEQSHFSPLSPVPVVSKYGDDEFDRLAAKYDFDSPVPVVVNQKSPSPVKLVRKPSKTKLKAVDDTPAPAPVARLIATQSIPEEDNDDIKYTSVDEINTLDFNVLLIVDVGETSGKLKSASDEVLVKLKESNVTHEVRKLNVGDFTWIAQHKIDKSKEFVLPYIIERKRLDDLSSSIKDGRFHEQKFRLKQCGVENVVYLIENHMKGGKAQHGLPFTTLLQAATNTQIHNKFQVKFTENNQHTVLYLTVMTSFIENIFKNRAPVKYKMMEFQIFNQSAVKLRRFTVRETFIKQLLALKGLSVDIALEITKFYPTPRDLYEKYFELSKADGENLLTRITIGDLKRKIPAPVSKSIYQFYVRERL